MKSDSKACHNLLLQKVPLDVSNNLTAGAADLIYRTFLIDIFELAEEKRRFLTSHLGVVASLDGEVRAGTIYGQARGEQTSVGSILYFAVDQRFQRPDTVTADRPTRQYGTILAQACLTNLFDLGVREVSLKHGSPRSIKFWRSLGFMSEPHYNEMTRSLDKGTLGYPYRFG